MQNMIGALLKQYGNWVTIRDCSDGVEEKVKALFQPALTRSWQNTSSEAMPLGMVSQGQYVYIGPAETAVSEGNVLLWEGRAFVFRRVEAYAYNGNCLYVWGLCVEKGVSDAWGVQS